MSRPPLFPQENARDTRPHQAVTGPRRRRALILLALLALVLAFALVATVGVLTFDPNLIGYGFIADLTQTQAGFRQTARALEATVQSNAQQALANEGTRAALGGLATRSALDIAATQTGIALANAQQATRAALDYQATQAAVDLAATQVELNFQGTRAALSQNATAVALGFATPSALITPTPPPLFDETFSTGAPAGLWTFQAAGDWSLSEDGVLTADRSGAWLLTERVDLVDYVLNVQFTPLQGAGLAARYYLLLNIPADLTAGGLALEVVYDGFRAQAVGLYRAARIQVLSDVYLAAQQLEPIQAVQVDLPASADLSVQVEVRGGRVLVFINQQAALDVQAGTLAAGAVGFYAPAGTRVLRITLLP